LKNWNISLVNTLDSGTTIQENKNNREQNSKTTNHQSPSTILSYLHRPFLDILHRNLTPKIAIAKPKGTCMTYQLSRSISLTGCSVRLTATPMIMTNV
jgi:hypothetical protein